MAEAKHEPPTRISYKQTHLDTTKITEEILQRLKQLKEAEEDESLTDISTEALDALKGSIRRAYKRGYVDGLREGQKSAAP